MVCVNGKAVTGRQHKCADLSEPLLIEYAPFSLLSLRVSAYLAWLLDWSCCKKRGLAMCAVKTQISLCKSAWTSLQAFDLPGFIDGRIRVHGWLDLQADLSLTCKHML